MQDIRGNWLRAGSRDEMGSVARNGGVQMAQSNKTREGNGAAAQTKSADSHADSHNVPARREEGARTMAHRNENPLQRLHGEIDSLFERFFGGGLGLAEWGGDFGRFWRTDMEEADNEIRVRAEAPGFEPKDFDIQINGNMLTVRAEHRQEDEQNEGGMHTWQRRYGQFQRSIPLSGPVDADKVEAHYRNGVLELR